MIAVVRSNLRGKLARPYKAITYHLEGFDKTLNRKTKILFVDDEETLQHLICATFKDDPFHIKTASNGEEALKMLKSFSADIVISDVRMPKMGGFELLRKIRDIFPDIFVVLVTHHDAVEDAVKAIKGGAYEYILKPFDFEAIRTLIKKISGHKEILGKGKTLGKERRKNHRLENFIGQDPKMFKVFERIMDIADSNATVLITGETGTGKELVADAIHYNSSRRSEPLVKVNCSALTESLITSELFGHEKGSFTGAVAKKTGYLELAHGGTIFLDEIGDISIQTQIALLRVLEQGTFLRVGGTQLLKVDTRFICATNKNLSGEVSRGNFREDFFYRINVAPVVMPPLRERKSDIPLLAIYFLNKYSNQAGKNIPRISGPAMHILTQHDWPGNVRELGNAMERAVIFCKGREVIPSNLAEVMEAIPQKKTLLVLSSSSLADAESTLIFETLKKTDWNLQQAARLLGIARGTLYSKMKKHNIAKLR